MLSFFRLLVAAGLAALVLALSVFAAEPDLHEKLHAGAHHADHECAIVLFAGGVALTVALAAASAREIAWREIAFAVPGKPRLASPRNLLPHACGPPCGRAES